MARGRKDGCPGGQIGVRIEMSTCRWMDKTGCLLNVVPKRDQSESLAARAEINYFRAGSSCHSVPTVAVTHDP